MVDFNFGDGLRKVMLVGIGAVATGVEKGQEIVDQLIEKGELTVRQGKELNSELKRNTQRQREANKRDTYGSDEQDNSSSSMPTPTPGTVYTIKTDD
jgi:polyhydroxyalkanoate synthesis regulator phasin